MDIDGEEVRKLRLKRMLTQADLAQKTELTQSTVNRLENGLQRARISTVRKLAKALGVKPGDILRKEDEA